MKVSSVVVAGLALFAAADGGDYCRKVKQERPVCEKVTRTVTKDFRPSNYKQKCWTEKVSHHENVHVDVWADKCKSSIVKVPNKRPVYINNKVCKESKGKGKDKAPDCKIEKTTTYVNSFDKVAQWHCDKHKSSKTVPVNFYTEKEVCQSEPHKTKRSAKMVVTEKRCHVVHYERTVCDNDKGGQYYKDGHGSDYVPTEYSHYESYDDNHKGYDNDVYHDGGHDNNDGHGKGGNGYGGNDGGYGGNDGHGKGGYGGNDGHGKGGNGGYGGNDGHGYGGNDGHGKGGNGGYGGNDGHGNGGYGSYEALNHIEIY